MFVTTANTLDTIPGPLRDRMEMIQLAGYTEEEKLEIARRYLVPRQIERNGLTQSADRVQRRGAARRSSPTTRARPACASSSARSAPSAARSRARSPRADSTRQVTISAPRVRELLGKRRVFRETRRRTSEPGVATGLAWTPVGGDVLFVEATAMPRQRQAHDHRPARRRDAGVGAGGAVVRAQPSAARAIDDDWFAEHDVHVHVPAGAIPKDGPSAGITIATALVSLLTRRARARRRRDDGRDHADRPGAADRRPEGEGARRPAQRHQSRDRAGAQRAGRRRDSRAPAQRRRLPLRLASTRCSRSRWRRAPRAAAPRPAAVPGCRPGAA